MIFMADVAAALPSIQLYRCTVQSPGLLGGHRIYCLLWVWGADFLGDLGDSYFELCSSRDLYNPHSTLDDFGASHE